MITFRLSGTAHEERREEVQDYSKVEQAYDHVEPGAHPPEPLVTVEKPVLAHVDHDNQEEVGQVGNAGTRVGVGEERHEEVVEAEGVVEGDVQEVQQGSYIRVVNSTLTYSAG